jgi:hypothetical protein
MYWYPLYAYVRRQGHNPEDAQDLTQEFFERCLEKQMWSQPERGQLDRPVRNRQQQRHAQLHYRESENRQPLLSPLSSVAKLKRPNYKRKKVMTTNSMNWPKACTIRRALLT